MRYQLFDIASVHCKEKTKQMKRKKKIIAVATLWERIRRQYVSAKTKSFKTQHIYISEEENESTINAHNDSPFFFLQKKRHMSASFFFSLFFLLHLKRAHCLLNIYFYHSHPKARVRFFFLSIILIKF